MRRLLVSSVLLGLVWGCVEAVLAARAGAPDPLSVAVLPPLVAGALGLLAAALLGSWAGVGPALMVVAAGICALPLAVWVNAAVLSGVPLVSLTNVGVGLGAFAAGLIPGALVARLARHLPDRPALAWLMLALVALCAWRSVDVLRPPTPGPWADNRPTVGSRPNLLVITVDTLRADHVSWAGYERPTTPHLDALPAWRFATTYAHAHWTTPSTASLLTSLHPSSHRTTDYADVLPDGARTLTQILAESGYVTGYFTANFAVSQPTGLTRGGDWVVSELDLPHRRLMPSTLGRILATLSGDLDRADRLNAHVLPFLESVRDRRFFLYVHYKDPHQPYEPPAPYDEMFDPDHEGRRILDPALRSQWPITPRERQNMVARYDGEIRFVDEQIGRLLEELERLNLRTNTIVVVTSDHGEEFEEHGGWLHGQTVYDETVRVPLLIYYAPLTRESAEVGGVVMRQVDVVPTLLDLMDLPPEAQFQGMSLLKLLRGDVRSHFGQERAIVTQGQRTGVAAWISGSRKLVRKTEGDAVTYELYDLARDPGETRDLSALKPAEVNLLKERFEGWERRQVVKRLKSQSRELDPEQEQALRELGYIR